VEQPPPAVLCQRRRGRLLRIASGRPKGETTLVDTRGPRRQKLLSAWLDIPVRIFYVPWLLPTWARAQVWGNVILVKRGVALTEGLLAHELAHVRQWRAFGVLGFLFYYARHLIRHGYEGHPLEIAARLAEQDDSYLNWAKEILRTREKPGP
jgi:hypothetical protein